MRTAVIAAAVQQLVFECAVTAAVRDHVFQFNEAGKMDFQLRVALARRRAHVATREAERLARFVTRLAFTRHPVGQQRQQTPRLRVSQQTYQSYEVGRRRIPVSALPAVARVLSVSLEELFGESDSAARKRAPAPKWQKQIEAIAQLPRAKQQFVSQMLDTVLAQAQR